MLSDGLAISPILALAALALALPLGAFAGVFGRDPPQHSCATPRSSSFSSPGLSIPNFAIATFLVYLVQHQARLLPVAGWGTPRQAILPVVILAIPSAAYIARLTRTFMLEVLQQDFIRTARAKGLRERLVIWPPRVPQHAGAAADVRRHHLRRAVQQHVRGRDHLQHSRDSAGSRSNSIFARDYPVAMAIVLLFMLFFALINLLVDLLYALIDPRIRAGMVA